MVWALGFCFVVLNNWILLDFLLFESEVSCCWQPGWCHCSVLRARAVAFPWWFNWGEVFSGMWVQGSEGREGSRSWNWGAWCARPGHGWAQHLQVLWLFKSATSSMLCSMASPPVINGQPGSGRENAAPCLQGNACLCCNYYKELFELSPQPLQRF